MQTALKWIGMTLGLVLVGLVVLGLVFDWNWIKGFVEREASQALGRTVVIEGDLDVQLSWSPLVRMDHIRIANAPWSPEPSCSRSSAWLSALTCARCCGGTWSSPPSSSSNPSSDWRPPSKGSRMDRWT